MGRGVDWAVRQWLVDDRKPREMRALRPDWSLESIKTKIKQQRRGAPDESRPLKWRRTSEVLAEIEMAVTETPRQTSSVLRRHTLDVVARSARRSPSAVLQARPCDAIDSGEPLGTVELLP